MISFELSHHICLIDCPSYTCTQRSFQSYNIRRLESRTIAPAKNSSILTAKGSKKAEQKKVGAVPVSVNITDFTDTVALLTPFVHEVDLWPAATQSMHIPAHAPVSVSASIDVVDEGHTSNRPAGDRSVFLREAKCLPALRYLENAMCDIR